MACSLVAGCGGGGGGSEVPPPPVPAPTPEHPAPTATSVHLLSDAEDYIGQGLSYSYDQGNAVVQVSEANGRLTISVKGYEQWDADFWAPNAISPLQVGVYAGLPNYPTSNPATAAFRWFGESRGCTTSTATVYVDQVAYDGGFLSSISLRFERHCENAVPALHGEFKWTRSDTTQPPGPQNPPPVDLWRPDPGSLPASGNYFVVESTAGDPVGLGRSYRHTDIDSNLWVSGSDRIYINLYGSAVWYGELQPPDGLGQLVPGYYAGLHDVPFYNPTRGGLSWNADGRGCSSPRSWMVIDAVTYERNGLITSLDLRFEQRCDGSKAVLHGALHWQAPGGAPAGPAATLSAPGSWRASGDQLPPQGNYVFLQSETGDVIFPNRTGVYTPDNAAIVLDASEGHLQLSIGGAQTWRADFQGPDSLKQLQPGSYDGLTRYAFRDPVVGGFDWGGWNTCSSLRAWVAVDAVSYVGTDLNAVDLRFEQACDSAPGVLHGQLHWSAADNRKPPGPLQPPPSALWRPEVGKLPGSGNYLYLQSDRNDFVGGGLSATYTQANAVLGVSADAAGLALQIDGDEHWQTSFQPMFGQAALRPGYYAGLLRDGFANKAKGSFDFSGEGRGCNELVAGAVVDAVQYSGAEITALDLRFEQHCEGHPGAMRGALHWVAGDPTQPPGPQSPPGDLWRPAADKLPATGSYVYLESGPGDFVGDGHNLTLPSGSGDISVSNNGRLLKVQVSGSHPVEATFVAMNSIDRVGPGYYPGLQRYPVHNPAKGGLNWSMDLRGCNTITGWYVVDRIHYTNQLVDALDLRFTQYCEGASEPLRGLVHWVR